MKTYKQIMTVVLLFGLASNGFGEPIVTEDLTVMDFASDKNPQVQIIGGNENFPGLWLERVDEGAGTKTPFVMTMSLGSTAKLNFKGGDMNEYPDWQTFMTITPEGNVGIGSMSPSERLAVKGNIVVYQGGFVQYGATVPPDIWDNRQLYVRPAGFVGTQGSHGLDIAWNAYRNNDDGTFHWIGVNDLDTASSISLKDFGIVFHANEGISGDFRRTARMIIKNNGNVGIGTTDPAHKLDVRGTIQALEYRTGDIIFQENGTKPVWRMYEDQDGLYVESLTSGKHYSVVLNEIGTEKKSNSKVEAMKAENKELKLRLEKLEAKVNALTQMLK
jgi:hypothetical protein